MTTMLAISRRRALGLLGTLLLASSACTGSGLHWVELKDQRWFVELAADDASQMRGLMFRDAMAADHGMLFIFERSEPQAFWMRNTRIPLDILYFDADLRLVSVTHGAPPCTTTQCPSYPSQGPARFVLELNAGQARRLGIKRGEVLQLDPRLAARLDLAGADATSSP